MNFKFKYTNTYTQQEENLIHISCLTKKIKQRNCLKTFGEWSECFWSAVWRCWDFVQTVWSAWFGRAQGSDFFAAQANPMTEAYS